MLPSTTYGYSGTKATFTAAATGYYVFDAFGGQGGNAGSGYLGGMGAEADGAVLLTAGTTVTIIVGGKGASTTAGGGGGGGGSFVFAGTTPLIIAGGGGGAGNGSDAGGPGDPGQTGTNGTDGYADVFNYYDEEGGHGGSNGHGGSGGSSQGDAFIKSRAAGGGGGFLTAGGNGNAVITGQGGQAALGTAAGGSGVGGAGSGGFGGGGGSAGGTGGGGGGFSGGGGGGGGEGTGNDLGPLPPGSGDAPGGGGGSFTASGALDVRVAANANQGNGSVQLTPLAGITAFTVATAADLNQAIEAIDLDSPYAAPNTAYVIRFAANITLDRQLFALNLGASDRLAIQGNGYALDGGGNYNGLFDYAGTVAISNLAINNAKAVGGNGGGGGAGLGGGLFVAAAGRVSLSDVTFSNDSAVGGGVAPSLAGGGGLEGGSGSSRYDIGGTSGGGGVGLSAIGTHSGPGGAGIILGAAAGGQGAGDGGQPGGASGGGGGAGGTDPGYSEPAAAGGGGGVGGGAGAVPGNGGAGGFGGGGGSENGFNHPSNGGNGGFGGGGAAGNGNGGFGGGGGSGGSGGFGAAGDEGGGLGAGGAIFVQQGGTLTYTAGRVVGGAVAGGPGALGLGSGLFLQGNQQITLSTTTAQGLTIDDVIADQTGASQAAGRGVPTGSSADGTPNAGIGKLLIAGPGEVTLAAVNTFVGGVTLQSGTLELANPTAAGSGPIAFAPGQSATLKVDVNDAPGNTITGFLPDATIDLDSFEVTSMTLVPGNLLLISGFEPLNLLPGLQGHIALQFDPAQDFSHATFHITSDGRNGTDLTVSEAVFVGSGPGPIKQPAPSTITGTVANQPVTDSGSVKPFAGVVIADPNAAGSTETVTITYGTADGTLSDPGLATDGGGFSNGAYAISGSASAVTAAVEGLVFTPTPNEVGPGGTTKAVFTITDRNSANQTTTSGDTSVITTSVEDAPTVSGLPPTTSLPDTGTATPFGHAVLTDPDTGQAETLAVTLSSNGAATDANGTLSGAGLTKTGTGTYQLTGSSGSGIAELQSALRGVVFTPTANEVAPGLTVTTGTSVTLDDGIESGTQTSALVTNSVNDAPTISGTSAGQTTTDYVPVKPFASATVADVDAGAMDSLIITVKDAQGQASDANGQLSGTGLSKTGTGSYTVAATNPVALTAELEALTFTPTRAEAAAGQTVTTSFTLAASDGIATTIDGTTSLTTTALNYIKGPANGFGFLLGTPGQDVITAHGQFNAILGLGGNDIINAGSGAAVVTLGNGNATVTLGGGFNAVIGGTGNNTVTGAPGGHTAVTLGDGSNTVRIGGSNDVILLGTGTNMVSGTQGMAFISTGAGNDTITLSGSGNTVNAGAGTNTIFGGARTDTFVLPAAGKGYNSISGFTEANGDVLDLRAALAATGWNHKASTLANYLHVTGSDGNTNLAIALAGSGAGTTIATLNGSNYGFADLVSHHSLVTA